MNRRELKALNAELVDLLTLVRDLIDQQLEELGTVTDDEPEDDEDPDQEAIDDEADED